MRPTRLGGLAGANGLSVLNDLERPGGLAVPTGLSGLIVATARIGLRGLTAARVPMGVAGLIVATARIGLRGLTVARVPMEVAVRDGVSGLDVLSGMDGRGLGANAAGGRRRTVVLG